MSESERDWLAIAVGTPLAAVLAWALAIIIRSARRGVLTRKAVVIAAIELPTTFAGIVLLLMLAALGPEQKGWLGVACLGGLAFIFAVLHVGMVLFGSKAGQRWLDGKRGGVPK